MTKAPLLERLAEFAAVTDMDGMPLFAADIREAIAEIERLRKLVKEVDVWVKEMKDGRPA